MTHTLNCFRNLDEPILSGDRSFLVLHNANEEYQKGDLIKFENDRYGKGNMSGDLDGHIFRITYVLPFENDQVIISIRENKTCEDIEEIRNLLIEHGQHDMRFSFGETIKYSPTEVEDILRKEWRK